MRPAATFEGLSLDADGCFTDRPDAIATWDAGRMAPTNPQPAELKIEDIARGLANNCRWNGQCRFYSVAEHSVRVSQVVPTLEALMHDASEAYLTDMSRPVKMHSVLGVVYRKVEERLELAIAEQFDLEFPWSDEIKRADYAVGFAEAKQLVPHLGALMPPVDVPLAPFECWTPEEAYLHFLGRFIYLRDTR